MQTLSQNGKVAAPPTNRLDPGPPYPGYNCHIVIDGVGYIFADLASRSQESQFAIGEENLAPMMGNPDNQLDTQSSDLTLLLPIGQNDFSAGIGATDLERTPKGYERGENLMWTPQNTLINGPKINFEPFTGNPNPTDSRTYQEGYFGGTVANSGLASTYFGIGSFLYLRSDASLNWAPVANANPITSLDGYSGRIIVGWGDSGGNVIYNGTAYAAQFRIWKSFQLNSKPFVINKDGRIYSAFLMPPDNVSITDQDGADTTLAHWAYAAVFLIKMPDNSLVSTGFGQMAFATKLPNKELVISVPNRGYHGGPVLRRLYRSLSNDLTNMYLLADETLLGPNATRYVDVTTDATLATHAVYDFTQLNSTGITALIAGEINRNMQFPDSEPIWLSQNLVLPQTGDFITRAATFHDAQGNEGVVVGTSSGLFIWTGLGIEFQTIRLSYYHPLNFRYIAVNHGWVYYTMMGHSVYMWSPEKTQALQGPWLIHFNHIEEIRLGNNSNYVAIAVTGTTKYHGANKVCIVYLFDGDKFVWSTSFTSAGAYSDVTPILGAIQNADMLAFWKGTNNSGVNTMSLDPVYSDYQTSGVIFRSAASDGDLPRLRKQVHAVMVRYLKLTPQPQTIITTETTIGATTIQVLDPTGFAIGDWFCIKDVSLVKREYRKINTLAGNVIGFTHPLGAPLKYDHPYGVSIERCAAVVTLRNVFTDTLPQQDIEVGGPFDAGELFAYIRLPEPVYTYTDGIEIVWRTGTVMELIGWSMLTGLNPQWNGLADMSIRLQDYVKLPNNMYDNALASTRQQQLKDAFNKGTVEVIDPLGNVREMRFQRLNFAYEEPKQRHSDEEHMQATANIRLIDQLAELTKQAELVLNIRSQ